MNNTAIVPMKLKQDLDVIQANELIRSRQDDMTLLEAKLIAVTVAQVLKQDTDLRTYTCNISDLADYLCMNKDFMYREIKDTCESIVKKSIYRKLGVDKRGRDNFEIFPWIDYVNYKDGVITIRLSDKLKPFLIGLNKCFTTCGIASLLGLPTPYSMKLLQYINSYQYLVYIPYDEEEEIRISEDEFRFPIEEIKEYFNCKDKYPNTSHFIKRVISPAVEAIQLNTSLRLSYRAEYKGRKITHIIFKFHSTFDREYDNTIAQLKEQKQ